MKKRKVYVFAGAYRAALYGIGTYIELLIACMKDSDIDFELIYLNAKGQEVSSIEKDGYRQISIPTVNYTQRNARYYARNVVYILRELIPEDKNIQYLFHLNFMENPELAMYLRKMFRSKTVLVVHYTNWSFSLSGNYQQLKTILHKPSKQLDPSERLIRQSVYNEKKMIPNCKQLVFVAKHTMDAFSDLHSIDPAKCLVVNNALRDTYNPMSCLQKSSLRQKYQISDDTFVILFAGRFDDVKGVSFLIKAFKKIAKENPQARLIIAGEGNFSQWLKESDKYWTKITFTGRLDKKQLYEFYNIADVGVICSLHEEFGLVALEMMMHALPVVVTKTGGLDEIVEDNVSGLKVPVRTLKGKRQVDVRCLSEKIQLLLDNPSLAKEIGENGRKRFLDKFELSVFKEKILNLYNNL